MREYRARELSHHARRTDGPDGVTFEMSTHARRVLTQLDVRLAERVSAIVANPEPRDQRPRGGGTV